MHISDIKFPLINVCPPRNTFTELNYYLAKAENIDLSMEIRQQLANQAAEYVLDEQFRYLELLQGVLEKMFPFFNQFHQNVDIF